MWAKIFDFLFDDFPNIKLFFPSAMKFAIIALALVAAVAVEGGVLSDNGLETIATIQANVEDIGQASDDLNAMEIKLAGLADEEATISAAKDLMTAQMSKEQLTNAFNHPNVPS